MKKKFKLYLYLIFSFLFLISFQNKSYTEEHKLKLQDKKYACNLFYKKVLESENPRARNYFSEISGRSFGFYPVYTYDDAKDEWNLLTDGKQIINQFNYLQSTAKLLKPGDIILKIEGIDAAKFYSKWWKNIKDLESIRLDIIDKNNEEKIIELKKGNYSYDKLFHYLSDLKIIDIDIKKSTYTTKITNTYQYKFDKIFTDEEEEVNHPLIDIAQNILVFEKEDGFYFRHVCRPDDKYFNNKNLMDPAKVKYPDVVNSDQDLETVENKVWLFSTKQGYNQNQLVFERNFSNNFVILNEFNLKSFPFDKQVLKFRIFDDQYALDARIFETVGFTFRVFESFLSKDDIPGWRKISATINNYDHKKITNSNNLFSGLIIELELERKHGYYIFKVIFPIILILMVCWSVVWVDPKELESRLTITIVCLLSLIAYNFVIDSELPKLEYLTVLDWIVLISYIYATIPNFLSIISFRLQKTNLKLSNKLEFLSKRYGLSSYIISIFLIILLNANLNPENSSSLISWMAGE